MVFVVISCAAGDPRSPSKPVVKVVPKKIGVAHIMKTINEVYGGGGARASGQAGSAQMASFCCSGTVCALILTLNKGRSKEVTLGKVRGCV